MNVSRRGFFRLGLAAVAGVAAARVLPSSSYGSERISGCLRWEIALVSEHERLLTELWANYRVVPDRVFIPQAQLSAYQEILDSLRPLTDEEMADLYGDGSEEEVSFEGLVA